MVREICIQYSLGEMNPQSQEGEFAKTQATDNGGDKGAADLL